MFEILATAGQQTSVAEFDIREVEDDSYSPSTIFNSGWSFCSIKTT